MDKAWYEGCVISFDEVTGKHLVRYDDDEEETLDIAKEKIEWVQETAKKLKRLRRHAFSPLKKMVIEDDDGAENEDGKVEESRGDGGSHADSCEDRRNNEVVEEAEDDEKYVKLEREEDEEDIAEGPKEKGSGKVEPRKRKVGEGENLGPAKKSKSGGEVGKILPLNAANNLESKWQLFLGKLCNVLSLEFKLFSLQLNRHLMALTILQLVMHLKDLLPVKLRNFDSLESEY